MRKWKIGWEWERRERKQIYILPLSPICQYVNAHPRATRIFGRFACCAYRAREALTHPRPHQTRPRNGNFLRLGNNHPCGEPRTLRPPVLPSAPDHNAPAAAQDARRALRAWRTAHDPLPKGSPCGATSADPRKSALVPPCGGLEKRAREGVEELRRVCFTWENPITAVKGTNEEQEWHKSRI